MKKITQDDIFGFVFLFLGILIILIITTDYLMDGRSIREANCNSIGGSYLGGHCIHFNYR